MNTKQLNEFMSRFFTALILLNVALALATFTYQTRASDKNKDSLTNQQKQNIIKQVTFSGYKSLSKNGCLTVIAEKINTGKWSDSWCGKHYSHLDLK